MNSDRFAELFEELYRETYQSAARRIRDKRDRLSPETLGLLTHLATTGPLHLTELARHTDRAQSTLSQMVDHLIQKDLLERETDPADARRTLIWLSPAGKAALQQSQQVLDPERLETATAALDPDERKALAAIFTKFNQALR